MSNVKTIFFHVGSGKTGSSAIQTGLARYYEKLHTDFGVIYPKSKDFGAAAKGKITSGNSAQLFKYLSEKLSDVEEQEFLLSFEKIIYKSKGSVIVFSNEQLEEGRKDKWEVIFKLINSLGCNSKVIYYVRNLVEHCYSVYGQMVKRSGYPESFDVYSNLYVPKFKTSLEKFLGLLDSNDIIVKVYDEEKKDIFNNFITLLTDKKANFPRLETVNRSLSSAELEILNNINKLSKDKMVSYNLSNWMIYNLRDEGINDSKSISHYQYDNIVKRNSALVDWVNDTFFNGIKKLTLQSAKFERVDIVPNSNSENILHIASELVLNLYSKRND